MSIVSPVTYSRGTPSPKPTVPSASLQATTRLSVCVRVCEACWIGFRNGIRTCQAVISATRIEPSSVEWERIVRSRV